MMKELYEFTQWQWRRFELWQKIYMFAMIMILVSLVVPESWRIWPLSVGMITVSAFMLKWFVWDALRNSYRQYRKEKLGLLDTIKHSGS